jgi:hypothetical protein
MDRLKETNSYTCLTRLATRLAAANFSQHNLPLPTALDTLRNINSNAGPIFHLTADHKVKKFNQQLAWKATALK